VRTASQAARRASHRTGGVDVALAGQQAPDSNTSDHLRTGEHRSRDVLEHVVAQRCRHVPMDSEPDAVLVIADAVVSDLDLHRNGSGEDQDAGRERIAGAAVERITTDVVLADRVVDDCRSGIPQKTIVRSNAERPYPRRDSFGERSASRPCDRPDPASPTAMQGPATRSVLRLDCPVAWIAIPQQHGVRQAGPVVPAHLASRIALGWERDRHVVTRSAVRTPHRCGAPAPAVSSEATKEAFHATDNGPARAAWRASGGRA